ncbi:MAG: discoidin domain-containing protein, partial [Planctomycetota bacterium]|nr:discoidin domain-containing protein [Planctomycetota bacterium]
MNASFRFVGLCVILAASASIGRAETPAATFAAQVEAQWLSPEGLAQARGTSATVSSVKTSDDARGAVDGVKNGKWGMHTEAENNPWWQVDLGEVQPLARVLVYNRCDFAQRAAKLALLLSDDGKAWREAYRHDGSAFYGFTDFKPLAISLDGVKARFVRIQLPGNVYLHLDEVEIFGPLDPAKNLAIGKPADQSSTSQWSVAHGTAAAAQSDYPVTEVLSRGRRLADDLAAAGADVAAGRQTLAEVEQALAALPADAPADVRRALYLKARWAVRKLALANPLLDFDAIVFAKHAPALFPHMSDQYYGWWSRPGGGIF